jgi:hypothetical protein
MGAPQSQSHGVKLRVLCGLYAVSAGAPGRIRTSDPQIRSLVLYPAELRAHLRIAREMSKPAIAGRKAP